MTRIATNKLLQPTRRVITNWNSDFMTSDGPNLSAKISLIDLGIPYDSHYRSRIILPAESKDYLLNYGILDKTTFLIIKVTYNGNYDYVNEDNKDPYYWYEPNNYNIEYYYEGNSGTTFPIGRLLILSGSYINKLPKIYLNNPLGTDVALDVLHADISAPITPSFPSSAITISNLYFNSIVTDLVSCPANYGFFRYTGVSDKDYWNADPSTIVPSGCCNGEQHPLTGSTVANINEINISGFDADDNIHFIDDGIFIDDWFNLIVGSPLTSIRMILQNSTDWAAYDVNDDISDQGDLDVSYMGSSNTALTFADMGVVEIYLADKSIRVGPITSGSTAFFIYEIEPSFPSGYTLNEYYIPFNTILGLVKDTPNIYLYTTGYTITLKFLSDFDCEQAYSRMMLALTSTDCIYITEDNIYIDGSTIPCLSGAAYDTLPPVIYYNGPASGTTWYGSGTTVPTNVYLHLVHNGITGWTLDSLKTLFISGITDCIDGEISLSAITFLLYNNSSTIPITGITDNGLYNVVISVTDNAGNNITHYISNIVVDDAPPIINYKQYVLNPSITGNTDSFSGASSAITSGIFVASGFTFNLNGFYGNTIYRLDIIDNVVEYVYDEIDPSINKYMLDILIVGWAHNSGGTIVYTGVTQPGEYLVRLEIKDSYGNEIINYLIMEVVWDVSIYSEGYWQDDKVWIDFTLWLENS